MLSTAIIAALLVVIAALGIARRNDAITIEYLKCCAKLDRKEVREQAAKVRQLETALASATDRANAANRRAAQAANAIRNLPPMVDAELPVGVHLGPFSVN